MDFGIKRLTANEDGAALFHLYDKWNRLRLVADQGSPWLADKPGHYVRLARMDGHPVALLNVPWSGDEQKGVGENGRFPQSYAVIIDHAVYAVIELYDEALFVLEVEENRWLLSPTSSGYALFDEAPSPFRLKLKLYELPTVAPIGRLQVGESGYDFGMTLPKRPLRRPAVLTLALVVLVARFGGEGR